MSGTRVRFASVEEFEGEQSRVIKEVRGREIAVFKVGDEYRAVLNFCVHIGGPLCEGSLTNPVVRGEGDEWMDWSYDESIRAIRCPWHSWEFDIETGQSLHSERYRVPVYEVAVHDGDVFIEL